MAVFGELLSPVGEHIAAAVTYTDLPDDAVYGVVHQLARLVPALARYAGDVAPPHSLDTAPASVPVPDFRVLVNVRNSMRRAGHTLREASAKLGIAGADRAHPAALRLSAAADYLAASRDLLRTHFAPGPSGRHDDGSYWAPVINSAPVTGALLGMLADHAGQLAPWMAGLSAGVAHDGRASAVACAALHDASAWLRAADEDITLIQRRHPPTAAGRRLLAAIPANFPGPRQPPRAGETLDELCQQTLLTCERLRHAAWSFARQARWSEATTSQNWRRDAFASAIVGHSCEVILRTLQTRAAQLGLDHATRGRIRAAANAAHKAWDTRRVIAGAWDILSTGAYPPGVISPVALELSDLVLRTGRMAYRNPVWTPAAGTGTPRAPGDLAPDADIFGGVLAAVHHSLHTIAAIAGEDMEAVRAAAADQRIYLPTRNVPAGWRISRRYKPAGPDQVDGLLRLYKRVLESDSATDARLNGLARAGRPQALLSRWADLGPQLASRPATSSRLSQHPLARASSPGITQLCCMPRRATRKFGQLLAGSCSTGPDNRGFGHRNLVVLTLSPPA